jgi:hypothetical protein
MNYWNLYIAVQYVNAIFCFSFYYLGSNRLRDTVTEEWRKLHNDELHNLCSSNIIIMTITRMTERHIQD